MSRPHQVIKTPQRHLAQVPNPPEVFTFGRILHQGHTIIRHFSKGAPELAQMCIKNNELQFQQINFGMFSIFKKDKLKNARIPIRDFKFVVWGKQAHNSFGRANNVLDEVCFSLVTATETIDMECRNKEERDGLARGFAYEIAKISSHKE